MKKHIVCFGDSNTHGYCADPSDCADGGIRFNESERWPRLLQQLLPLLSWLLWGLLQRPRGLLPPPHLQLPLVWEGLLPAEELLLPAEVQLPETMLPLGELVCRCCWASACSHC